MQEVCRKYKSSVFFPPIKTSLEYHNQKQHQLAYQSIRENPFNLVSLKKFNPFDSDNLKRSGLFPRAKMKYFTDFCKQLS